VIDIIEEKKDVFKSRASADKCPGGGQRKKQDRKIAPSSLSLLSVRPCMKIQTNYQYILRIIVSKFKEVFY